MLQDLNLRLTGIRDTVEGILPRVSKPARYTGGEVGEIKKDHSSVDVLFALAFPDVYEVGMSNLGLKILYHTLNRRNDTAAERVFAPNADMEDEMRSAGIALYALESFAPLREFNIIGFSLSYELTYTNVLNMLDLAGIPVASDERTEEHPLIIAGGHCTVNPEPMADFIDAFVIGDGEEAVHSIVDAYKAHRDNRAELLQALAAIEGVYVPSVHGTTSTVKRTFTRDIENTDYPDNIIIPYIETIHERVAIEIMRGCSRSCRFCQAGMITRPIREKSAEKIMEQADTLIQNTGYDDIGLMSLSSADHSKIGEIVRSLIDEHESDRVGVSLPSIRADANCVKFAAEIERVRKSGLTFAPEAGTQRLRDAINKNVTEEDLLGAVETAVSLGWRKIKLYFMIGLPTETDEDIVAIGDLVRKVLDVAKARRRPLAINVGVSSFVPKPHTPFQWRGQNTIEELQRKIGLLRDSMRIKGVALSWHDTETSWLEAVFARGGRELGPAVRKAWETGAKFDGWDDRFKPDVWRQAFADTGVDADFIAHREIDHSDPLPWSHIDCGVQENWMAIQDTLADQGETTPDCRGAKCLGCGISGIVSEMCIPPQSELHVETTERKPADRGAGSDPNAVRYWQRMTYSKEYDLRWISHLDLVRVIERAVRRAGIPVAYSEGFNPRPRMSFYSQLSVGMTGEAEPMNIELTEKISSQDLMERLNAALPAGLKIRSAEEIEGRKSPAIRGGDYLIGISGNLNGKLDSAVDSVMASTALVVERRREKGNTTVDIRPGLEEMTIVPADGHCGADAFVRAKLVNVRPTEVVTALSEQIPGLEMRFAHRVRLY